MKTSVTQFEIMVAYMEQHGDLNYKPAGTGQEKVQCIQHWETLTDLLNNVDSGETKPTEKWKKVWSDFKNNTKKKAARIHRASIASPAGFSQSKLSDLEQRVLNITGTPSADALSKNYGLENVFKISFPQVLVMETVPLPSLNAPIKSSHSQETPPAPSSDDIVCNEDWNQTVPSTPAPVHSPSWPAVAGHTPCRYVLHTRKQKSHWRHVRPSMSFLHCDTKWRQFQMERQKQQDENEKERLRLRALELQMNSQMQERWQLLIERMLDVLNKIVESKLCK